MDLKIYGQKLKGLRAENSYSCEEMSLKLKEKMKKGIHRETFRLKEKNFEKMEMELFLNELEILGVKPHIFFKLVFDNSQDNGE